MSRFVIASQLSPTFNAAFLAQSPELEIVAVPIGSAEAPRGIEVMIAWPFRHAGGELPPEPPPGWPFDLKWVQLISVGIDFYPLWLFDGPVVTSGRGASAVALAEFALASIFAQAKRMPQIWIDGAEAWTRRSIDLVQGQTLGLVGFGSIGEALAPRALALGMNVVAVRRSRTPIGVPGVERVADVGEVFARSDHLVLAAPATSETERMVDRHLLARAKPGLHLINVARGSLIDDGALLDALDAGQVALASLDVSHPEPLPPGHPFYIHERIRLSPHTCVHTPDTVPNLAAHFADNLARFRRGEPLNDVVDIRRGY